MRSSTKHHTRTRSRNVCCTYTYAGAAAGCLPIDVNRARKVPLLVHYGGFDKQLATDFFVFSCRQICLLTPAPPTPFLRCPSRTGPPTPPPPTLFFSVRPGQTSIPAASAGFLWTPSGCSAGQSSSVGRARRRGASATKVRSSERPGS